jgi:hypothetical protein
MGGRWDCTTLSAHWARWPPLPTSLACTAAFEYILYLSYSVPYSIPAPYAYLPYISLPFTTPYSIHCSGCLLRQVYRRIGRGASAYNKSSEYAGSLCPCHLLSLHSSLSFLRPTSRPPTPPPCLAAGIPGGTHDTISCRYLRPALPMAGAREPRAAEANRCVCVCVCVRACAMYLYMHASMYVCMYVCMYVRTYA